MNKPSCPVCGNSDADKHGTTQPKDKRKKCKPRFRCRNSSCHRTFHTRYTYTACDPKVKAGTIELSDVCLVRCPVCDSDNVVRNGTSKGEKQRYLCRNTECSRKTFQEAHDYTYTIRNPKIKEMILKLFNGGDTIQNISKRFGVSENTLVSELKKARDW